MRTERSDYEDEKTKTHLSRLGVNPVVTQRLQGWAIEDDETLRDLVRYILSDYAPPESVLDE